MEFQSLDLGGDVRSGAALTVVFISLERLADHWHRVAQAKLDGETGFPHGYRVALGQAASQLRAVLSNPSSGVDAVKDPWMDTPFSVPSETPSEPRQTSCVRVLTTAERTRFNHLKDAHKHMLPLDGTTIKGHDLFALLDVALNESNSTPPPDWEVSAPSDSEVRQALQAILASSCTADSETHVPDELYRRAWEALKTLPST